MDRRYPTLPPRRWRQYRQMAPHLCSTPAAAAVLLVSGSCCSTGPPSSAPAGWPPPSMRPPRKVRVQTCVRCKDRIGQWPDSDVVPPSGHNECVELLLSYGAPIDMEFPVVGTPLYSACMARAAACAGLLLQSGQSGKSHSDLLVPLRVKCEQNIKSLPCFGFIAVLSH